MHALQLADHGGHAVGLLLGGNRDTQEVQHIRRHCDVAAHVGLAAATLHQEGHEPEHTNKDVYTCVTVRTHANKGRDTMTHLRSQSLLEYINMLGCSPPSTCVHRKPV